MSQVRFAAPQLLVANLDDALTFYTERLGFATDFVYEGFYAGISRDGAIIHLKCAPSLAGETEHRRQNEHLHAYLEVTGVEDLHRDLVDRGAPIAKPLGTRPWGAVDFYVEDPDGHVLCFGEIG